MEGIRTEEADHPKREEICILFARNAGIADVEEYEDLPDTCKQFLSHIPYLQLVQPLAEIDRLNGCSHAMIARKYGLKWRQVQYMFCCKTKFDIR